MLVVTFVSIVRTVCSCFLADDPPAHSPTLEFDLTTEGCQTVCQVESNKTGHIKAIPHILKNMLSDVRVVSH